METFIKSVFLSALMIFAQTAFAVESGTVLKGDVIRKEPYSDSMIVTMLNTGEKVSILKKDGGWLNVKSTKGSGWVRMLSIRKGDAAQGSNIVNRLKGLSSGRAGTGKVVATTGIRGLDEEELKTAKFDEVELKLLESFTTSKNEAQNFASQGKLKSRSVEYLPVLQ